MTGLGDERVIRVLPRWCRVSAESGLHDAFFSYYEITHQGGERSDLRINERV
jgi:hypothetical protein